MESFESDRCTSDRFFFILNYSLRKGSRRILHSSHSFGWSRRTVTYLDLFHELFHLYFRLLWSRYLMRNHFRSLNIFWGSIIRQQKMARSLVEPNYEPIFPVLAWSQLLDQMMTLWYWMGFLEQQDSRGMSVLAGLQIGNGSGSGSFSCLVAGIEEYLVGNHSSQFAAS